MQNSSLAQAKRPARFQRQLRRVLSSCSFM